MTLYDLISGHSSDRYADTVKTGLLAWDNVGSGVNI